MSVLSNIKPTIKGIVKSTLYLRATIFCFRKTFLLLLVFYCSKGEVFAQQIDTTRINQLIEEGYRLHNNNPRRTISGSFEALNLIGESELPSMKGEILTNLGLAYWRLDMYDSSNYYNHMGKALADSIGNIELSSRLLNNIALVYRERDQYAVSLELFLKVYEIQKQYGDSVTMSVILVNIGDMYSRMKDYPKALEYFKQAIDIAALVNANMTFCWGYVFSIEPHYLLGHEEEALMFFDKAIPACQKVDNLYHQSVAYMARAKILKGQARFDEALKEFSKALEIQMSIQNLKLQAKTFIEVALLHLEQNKLDEASDNLLKAHKIAENNSFLEELSEVNFYLSKAFRIQRNFEKADERFRVFYELKDSLNRVQRGNEIEAINSRYEIQRREDENESLRRERILQDEIIAREQSRNRYFNFALIAASFLILSLIMFLIAINGKNKRLTNLNQGILEKSMQLTSANLEIQEKNTELQTTLNQLNQAQDKLIESEKMASLGMLSAGVGHEINNPLNFIRNSVEVMETEVTVSKKDQKEFKRYITIINEGVTRISNIVKSLGGFARQKDELSESCDIHSIIDNCLTILNHKIYDRVKIKKDYRSKKCFIFGNEGKLHQAFLNIISNAEQSIHNSGEIVISTKLEDERAHITICDTGAGMSKGNLNKIMNPFFTTKGQGKGTGLGLWITYNIIKDHKGTIQVNSELGKGTEVYISLPVTGKH